MIDWWLACFVFNTKPAVQQLQEDVAFTNALVKRRRSGVECCISLSSVMKPRFITGLATVHKYNLQMDGYSDRWQWRNSSYPMHLPPSRKTSFSVTQPQQYLRDSFIFWVECSIFKCGQEYLGSSWFARDSSSVFVMNISVFCFWEW